jgi:hypothetical protein
MRDDSSWILLSFWVQINNFGNGDSGDDSINENRQLAASKRHVILQKCAGDYKYCKCITEEQSYVLIFRALRYVCRLAKRFATQFFIANNLLHNSLNILIGSLDGYITHLIFLQSSP